MAKKVISIPAHIKKYSSVPIAERRKRKVAGYARVSTDHDDQFTSYEAQIDYYTKYIKSRDDWEFVQVYTDEGITGTSTKRREGFRTMVADALNGKIDLIVTKSVSRFARNTVDSLTTIRQLKEKGIEVYFEKENIWTFDGKGELLLTIMSSLAQEESRSISENCTWGQRKRFADGKVSVAYKRFLGYDKGEDGNLVINPEEAVTVKKIYHLFLQGKSYGAICNQLMTDGDLSPGGKKKWNISTVKSILTNEKYKGDALLQKSYTVDFLTKKTKINEGEIPQYYVEGNHEAIIDPDVFEMVQWEIARRGKGKKYHSGTHEFSSMIKCGCCGSWYGSKVWHSNSKYRRIIWQCNQKYQQDEKCDTPHFYESELHELFLKAINALITNRNSLLSNIEAVRDEVFSTAELEISRDELQQELGVVADLVEKCIQENAHVAQDQKEYQARYDKLVKRYETTKAEYEKVSQKIQDLQIQRSNVDSFLKQLKKQDSLITEFDVEMFRSLVTHLTVYTRNDVRFTFKDGTIITVGLDGGTQ